MRDNTELLGRAPASIVRRLVSGASKSDSTTFAKKFIFACYIVIAFANAGMAADLLTPVLSAVSALGIAGVVICLAMFINGGIYSPFLVIPALSVVWYDVPTSYYFLIKDQVSLLSSAQQLYLYSTLVPVMCAAATAMGIGFKFFQGPIFKVQELSPRVVSGILVFNAALGCVQAIMIATGKWSFGTMNALMASGESSPFLQFMFHVGGFSLPVTMMLLGHYFRRGKIFRPEVLIAFGIFAVDAYWTFVSGRRSLSNSSLLGLLLFFIVYFHGKKITFRALAIALISVACAGAALNVTSKMFYALRLHSWSAGDQRMTFSFADTISAMTNADKDAVSTAYDENVKARPFIVDHLAFVLNNSHGFLAGRLMLQQALINVPTVILKDKSGLGSAPEELWTTYLGTPFTDYANTELLDGWTDFGFLGFFIYLAIICCLQQLVFKITDYLKTDVFSTIFHIATLCTMAEVEGDIGDYFTWARNMIIILIGSLIAIALAKSLGRSYTLSQRRLPGLGSDRKSA